MNTTVTSSQPEDEILFEVINHVGLITLNRPKVLNALSHGMVRAMAARLDAWAADAQIRAVVLRGAGEKAFCAGGDIRSLYNSWHEHGALHHDFFIDEYRLDYQIHRFAKPYVALMDGIVMGGGMGLAQGASLRLVTERTRVAMPETGIGLMPDVGASYFLARTQRELALYLGITGQSIFSADTLFCSLADAFVPHAALADLEQALSGIRWSADPQADIYAALGARPAAPEVPPLFEVLPALHRHFSAPDVAAIMQSLSEESDPRYQEWAQKTLKTMQTRSPLMMNVTRRQLLHGRRLDLADCFRMELGLVHHCFEDGDFIEGVRALIVDKDNAPQWQRAPSAQAAQQALDRFFTSPWESQQHPLAALGRH
ncbi:MAG TPA: enoyl-CoA hydratase/isomerase family protein [Burkholderiaceae bacterium]|nr:enoyl-CoA hydratase/isomerase family protein [Burkholderiaceae bacterium]